MMGKNYLVKQWLPGYTRSVADHNTQEAVEGYKYDFILFNVCVTLEYLHLARIFFSCAGEHIPLFCLLIF